LPFIESVPLSPASDYSTEYWQLLAPRPGRLASSWWRQNAGTTPAPSCFSLLLVVIGLGVIRLCVSPGGSE
jgi:hypothetical protein